MASAVDGATPQVRRTPAIGVGAWLLVAVAIEFNLWTLRAEAAPVTYQNDSVVHITMVEWARDRIEVAQLPFDGWFPNLGLGSAQFHHYQSLPHIVTGLLATVFGTEKTFAVLLYLLLCFWPLSVYWSARLVGWGRWPSAIAALVAPLVASTPGFGYESSSYTWQGWGLWPQLWAMWLLPLAWASTWRAVAQRGSISLAALVLSATVACHYMTGYLAFLSVGVIVVIGLKDFGRRLLRGVLVVVAALAASAWVVVPIWLDRAWIVKDEFLASVPIWHDSFGARKVLGWLLWGELFDGLRFPTLTILVGVGMVVCVARWRRDERARLLLALFVLSLLLFFGRPTLGPVLDLLPASEELFLHRYIIGVHMAGILLAGVGGAWLGRSAFNLSRSHVASHLRPLSVGAALAVTLLVVLWPALQERAASATQGGRWIREQRAVDATEGRNVAALVQAAASSEPGRFYSGLLNSWGERYTIGYVPIFRVYAQWGADSIGNILRTASLSTTIEPRFDETNPGHYDMFNVRHLILHADQQPLVPAAEVTRRGQHVLWTVDTSGYFQFVDIVGPVVVANRSNIGPKMEPFMNSDLPGRGHYQPVSFAGSSAASITADPMTVPPAPPGTVSDVAIDMGAGYARATVDAERPGALILKVSFDPRWRVTVDGVQVPPQMFSPSFVGRELTTGRHEVSLEYIPFPRYDILVAIAVVSLLGPTAVARLRHRSRDRSPDPDDD
jgi:hypothetical protein